MCATCCRHAGGCAQHRLLSSRTATHATSAPAALASAPVSLVPGPAAPGGPLSAPSPGTPPRQPVQATLVSRPREYVDLVSTATPSGPPQVTPSGPPSTTAGYPYSGPPPPSVPLDLLNSLIEQALARRAVPSTAQPFQPASHLSTYPAPQGGSPARPPFEAALSGEVSPQHLHNTIRVSGGAYSPTTVQISSPGSPITINSPPESSSTAARLATRPTASTNPFARLQKSLRPVDILASDKAPSTPEALETALHAWFDEVSPEISDRRELTAVSQFVRATIGHLKVVDCKHVLDYHRACATATEVGLYDTLRDGAIYPLAFSVHIAPYLSTRNSGRTQRDWPARNTGRKRKAADASDSTTPCHLPGHGGHMSAKCYTLHPELRPAKDAAKKSKVDGAGK